MTPQALGLAAAEGSARVATMFQQALIAQQQGRAQHAEELCASLLEADPGHCGAWHLRGLLALQGGRADEGIEWLERSVVLDPHQPAAHSNLGNAWLTRGEPQRALASFERALRLKPDYAVALFNRGNALRELGRREEALSSYDEALRLNGSHVAAHNNRGLVLLELGRAGEALSAFEQVVQLDPAFAEGQRNRAAALLKLERPAEALAAYDGLRAVRPQDAEVWCGHGCALLALGRLQDARASFTRSLDLDPTQLDSLINRGHALQLLHRPAAALGDYERALAHSPDALRALNNSGNALLELGNAQAALARYDRALAVAPRDPDTLYNRGAALHALKRYDESAQCYTELLRLAPGHDYALGGLFHLRMDYCSWGDYVSLESQLREALRRDREGVNPRSVLLCDSPQLQLRSAQVFARDKYIEQRSLGPCAVRARAAGERLRVAYVSADFGEHPVSHLLVGVLERHDRKHFEPIGVSLRARNSGPFEQRVRAAFDRFIETGERSDEEVARLLRALEVDVAVDLMGYTQGLRLGIFAHRAAPVQATYLGYAGTTGAPYMDYLIADEVVIPAGEERYFSESVVRLPHCYLPNDDRRPIAPLPTREAAGLPSSGVVLCAFTNAYKINPPVFAVWMRLLREIAGSVLWLRGMGEAARGNLQREAQRCGVASSRLVFAPQVAGMAEHLGRQSLADLYLDTQPYNAHSTACDALWAGVPVLTCAGRSFASRVAASVLRAVGLPELITHTLQEYEAQALELLRAPAKLGELREKLSRQRLTAPLFDTERYTRHLERAYLAMHERAALGAPPAAFNIADADPWPQTAAAQG